LRFEKELRMTLKADVLACFSGAPGARPLYLPDLTLWYDWHQGHGTLPGEWQDYSLPQVARALGVAIWLAVPPYRVETPGVEIVTTEGDGERVIRSHTSAGTLVARWMLGPDGDWWQTEYPVKRKEDLAAVLEIAKARSYILDTPAWGRWEGLVGDDGVLALEIPRRPYSDLLHEFLGWSEGLLFLREPAVQEINDALEAKLQPLVEQVSRLPGELVLSPDNLDGQFISPRAFQKYLAESYRRTTKVLQQSGKRLVVHIGGPIRHLLAPLAEAGVDGLEGIAGPPQSDLSLAEARQAAGPGLTLWGGIPQDFTLDTHERERLEEAVKQAVQDARGDARMILGVADRVPVNADLGRLRAIPALIEQALSEAGS
jgi:hypothetical protein